MPIHIKKSPKRRAMSPKKKLRTPRSPSPRRRHYLSSSSKSYRHTPTHSSTQLSYKTARSHLSTSGFSSFASMLPSRMFHHLKQQKIHAFSSPKFSSSDSHVNMNRFGPSMAIVGLTGLKSTSPKIQRRGPSKKIVFAKNRK